LIVWLPLSVLGPEWSVSLYSTLTDLLLIVMFAISMSSPPPPVFEMRLASMQRFRSLSPFFE